MSRTRDQAVADATQDPVDVVGRCIADGCPNIWTTASSKLCRWHAASPSFEWPRLTEALNTDIALGAIDRQRLRPPVPQLTKADKLAILAKLRALFTGDVADPKAWAYELRRREQAGEELSENQRVMWRSAIEAPGDFAQVDIDRLDRLKAESAARVARYAREHGIATASERGTPSRAREVQR